jgi:hypothetical protein
MTNQHTPGPWTLEVGDHTHRYSLVKDANERTVHYKYGVGKSSEADLDEANARLIAASPAMFDALREIDRLSLVIDSAVRHSEGAGHSNAEAVKAALKTARAALRPSAHGEAG